MSSLFAMRALLFAGEMLGASALVMALSFLAALRKTASRRHLVWLCAFGILLLIPALAALLPSLVRFVISAPAVPLGSVAYTLSTALPPADPGPDYFDLPSLARVALALWLAGVCVIALRGVLAAFGLRALRRASVAYDFADMPEPDSRCELRVSMADESCGPVTWGILRPVILLPRNAIFWPRARLEAVLLHEMAHIGRHDSLAQLFSHFVCALYWPNPLVWLGARAMRREAEMAADDAVIMAGVKPSAYAGELLQLAAEFITAGPSTALSMAAPSALEARVKSVLAPTQQRSGVTKMDVLKISCAALLATSALVLARPSLAQETPQAATEATPAVTSAPLAPPAQEAAPAAPPAPAAEATPPAPPAMPADDDVQVREDLRTVNGRQIRHVQMIVRRAKLQELQAQAALAKVQPEIEKAIADAKISEKAAQAIRDAQPQIDEAWAKAGPEIDKALEQARVALAKANLDVKINERVDRALKRVEIRIQARDANREKSDQKVRSEESDMQDDDK